ncbi:hypothetical protein, partial [Alicyclobacillus macrosporangiidus]|uniref:hypothetical protein n=1 Tax=Alicyclobacillus macrosporangiidus TaxID=392015 RepID=UPI001E3633F9
MRRFESLVTSVERLYEADVAAHTVQPDFPSADLNQVAKSAVQLFGPRCAEAGIRLELHTPD